jgi:hypothetical protein
MSACRPLPPSRGRRLHAGRNTGEGDGDEHPDLRVACAVILVLGLALVAFGAWGLARASSRPAPVIGFGTSLVLGSVLVVFAALLPWLGDGPVRLGPLTLTLRLRRGSPTRAAFPRRRRRRCRRPHD